MNNVSCLSSHSFDFLFHSCLLQDQSSRTERSIHRVADNLSAQEWASTQPTQGTSAHGLGCASKKLTFTPTQGQKPIGSGGLWPGKNTIPTSSSASLLLLFPISPPSFNHSFFPFAHIWSYSPPLLLPTPLYSHIPTSSSTTSATRTHLSSFQLLLFSLFRIWSSSPPLLLSTPLLTMSGLLLLKRRSSRHTSPASSLTDRQIDAKGQTIGIHYILKAGNTNALPTAALVPSYSCNNPPPAIHTNGP